MVTAELGPAEITRTVCCCRGTRTPSNATDVRQSSSTQTFASTAPTVASCPQKQWQWETTATSVCGMWGCYQNILSDKRNEIKARCKFDCINSHFIVKDKSTSKFIEFCSSNLDVKFFLNFQSSNCSCAPSLKISSSKVCVSPTVMSDCSCGLEPMPKARDDGRFTLKLLATTFGRPFAVSFPTACHVQLRLVMTSWFLECGNSQKACGQCFLLLVHSEQFLHQVTECQHAH